MSNADKTTFIAIIPARFASTRFPGKPLAMLGGKPIIERVYRRVAPVFDETIVATDDDRILNAVEQFGGRAVMTDSDLRSGTDRVAQAYRRLGKKYDVVVNVQGDEPFIQASQLEAVKQCFRDQGVEIATLAHPFRADSTYAELQNPNSPKIVFDKNMNALYFSRSVIPFVRGCEPDEWSSRVNYYKHIGLYAYRSDVLPKLSQLKQSRLEQAESLEQLRWLENGFNIRVALTDVQTIGIDTPADLQKSEKFLAENQ